MMTMRKIRRAFTMHRRNARYTGFFLTFEEWLKIWTDSGHLHERGRGKGKYVMARFGDKGPYAVGNVKIITGAENCAEQTPGKHFHVGDKNPFFGKTHKKSSRVKIGKSKVGNKYACGKRTPEQCARIRETRWGVD